MASWFQREKFMVNLIKTIILMHGKNVNGLGLKKTALSYLILIIAVLLLLGGTVFILKDVAGIKSISLIRIDFN